MDRDARRGAVIDHFLIADRPGRIAEYAPPCLENVVIDPASLARLRDRLIDPTRAIPDRDGEIGILPGEARDDEIAQLGTVPIPGAGNDDSGRHGKGPNRLATASRDRGGLTPDPIGPGVLAKVTEAHGRPIRFSGIFAPGLGTSLGLAIAWRTLDTSRFVVPSFRT